jgi:hypothetical protein
VSKRGRRLGRKSSRRYEHVCLRCGDTFTAAYPVAKWCGKLCKDRAAAQRLREGRDPVLPMRFQRQRSEAISKARTQFSDEFILAAIRRCAADLGAKPAPTYPEYEEWSKNHSDMPSAARVVQRFGRWRLALAAAKLVAPKRGTFPNHSRVYDDAACVAAIRECGLAVGGLPTYREYEEFARRDKPHKGHRIPGAPPSGQTIRNKLAGRWLDCLALSFPENPNVSSPR